MAFATNFRFLALKAGGCVLVRTSSMPLPPPFRLFDLFTHHSLTPAARSYRNRILYAAANALFLILLQARRYHREKNGEIFETPSHVLLVLQV